MSLYCRYDAFCELHDRVHTLHAAQQGLELDLKQASALKLVKSYFGGVRVERIDFERRAQDDMTKGSNMKAPVFVVSWDPNATAELRENILRTQVWRALGGSW